MRHQVEQRGVARLAEMIAKYMDASASTPGASHGRGTARAASQEADAQARASGMAPSCIWNSR
jgi:hypothetical protein